MLSAGAAPPELSSGAPEAEAVALAELSDEPVADSETAPFAVRFRASVASLRWFAMVSATETPMAADEPSASPSASVPADADWSALAPNAPVIRRSASGATSAVVVTFESVIATDGTRLTLPPAAPVFELLVAPSMVFAVSVRLRPPTSVPVSDASVLSSMRLTATAAPMPSEEAAPVPSAGA